MAVSATFGQMEDGLAKLHRIAGDKRTNFMARLRKFQRSPVLIPTAGAGSRGSSTTYSPLQVMEVALALELTEFGMGPERMAKRLRADRWNWLQGMGNAARIFIEENVFAGSLRMGPVKPTYWLFDPNNLEELTCREGQGAPRRRNDPNGIYDDPAALLSAVASMYEVSRFAMINLTRIFAACQTCFTHRDRPLFTYEAYRVCREESVKHSIEAVQRIYRYGLEWTEFWMAGDLPPTDESRTFVEELEWLENRLVDFQAGTLVKGAKADEKRVDLPLAHGQRFVIDLQSDDFDELHSISKRLKQLKKEKEKADDNLMPMLWVSSKVLNELGKGDLLKTLASMALEAGVPILANNSLRWIATWLLEIEHMNQGHDYVFKLTDEQLGNHVGLPALTEA